MRVFISHSSTNEEIVTRLLAMLQEIGLHPWVDRLNEPAALDECGMLIAVLSPAALESGPVQEACGYFIDQGKPIVVVIAEPCAVPEKLRGYSRVDFSQGASLPRLAHALGASMPTRPLDARVLSRFEENLKRLDDAGSD